MIHDSLLSGSGVIIQKVSGRKRDKLLTEGAPRKDAGAEDGSGSAVLGEAMTGDKKERVRSRSALSRGPSTWFRAITFCGPSRMVVACLRHLTEMLR